MSHFNTKEKTPNPFKTRVQGDRVRVFHSKGIVMSVKTTGDNMDITKQLSASELQDIQAKIVL